MDYLTKALVHIEGWWKMSWPGQAWAAKIRGPWPLLNLRPLYRNVIFAIENHFSLAKWLLLLVLLIASSASVMYVVAMYVCMYAVMCLHNASQYIYHTLGN